MKSTNTTCGRRSAPQDHGKFVAIDIESRQWEIDADEMAADERLLRRIPDANWATRVGLGYLYRFGAASGGRRDLAEALSQIEDR